jgi:hypothetical protein
LSFMADTAKTKFDFAVVRSAHSFAIAVKAASSPLLIGGPAELDDETGAVISECRSMFTCSGGWEGGAGCDVSIAGGGASGSPPPCCEIAGDSCGWFVVGARLLELVVAGN